MINGISVGYRYLGIIVRYLDHATKRKRLRKYNLKKYDFIITYNQVVVVKRNTHYF